MREEVDFLGNDLGNIRNISAGGDVNIDGNATIGHNLKVQGWLEAPNIKDSNKGIFSTYVALGAAYPNPQDGWFAFVGSGTSLEMIVGNNGSWVQTGNTVSIQADISAITSQLANKQDRLTAGTNINIDSNNVISATGSAAPHTAGNGININPNNEISIDTNVVATQIDLSDKADKVSNATNGDLAGLDSNGNLTDSGITGTSVSTAVTNSHTHSNKSLLDTYTQTESDIADAVSKKHSHSNKTLLDMLPSTLGTAGQVPTIDSSGTGIVWSTPSGGGGGASYTIGDGLQEIGSLLSILIPSTETNLVVDANGLYLSQNATDTLKEAVVAYYVANMPQGVNVNDYVQLQWHGTDVFTQAKKPVVHLSNTNLTGADAVYMEPGYTYICENPITAIEVYTQNSQNDYLSEYHLIFQSDGSALPSVNLPLSVVWADGTTPYFREGRYYELNIVIVGNNNICIGIVTEYI